VAPNEEPLVTVITPVYNGAAYIAECIESVLRQTYTNWRYIVSDNASTDDTVAIAARYAARDSRITVQENHEFLDLIDNWNRALSCVDPEAAYCKVIHADDWIYPECLEEMVALARQNPSVGIVSAYRLEELKPGLWGLPYGQTVTPGPDVCRDTLAKTAFLFGSPSNILMRADLVRKSAPFYDAGYLHADKEVCLRMLQESDFGFVFKILSFTRRHNESETSRSMVFSTRLSEDLLLFKQYGPSYFSEAEFDRMLKRQIRSHYRLLGRAVFQKKGEEFWTYQASILHKLGLRLSYMSLGYSALLALLDFRATVHSLREASKG
jgi:glycosyltransferase involved in cell wall biosynthesis